ncbi:molybdenum ABC transporter ATP-binding protein [Rhizobium sp. C4]|uniref:molybdenum ABC transporter ATP-binding protein n=1 Tax=Rhizobium sp. C4 TaxID=1349800 RepID=UPI001E65B0F2|nr:molybdenum ABC transporter ATP-binding protein [Rhizobium sp. C4]MCD2172939.1 molybdenum ABC transporter ATP-binding protein [Rhizobium sp. C4]
MFEIDIRHAQGDFKLEAAFTAGDGLTALVGPSGSGKTTLANIAAGLIRPEEGRVTFNGETWFDSERTIFLPADRRRIGYVFQEGRLFPHMTVRQNLNYARHFRPTRTNEAADARLIELLGIGHLLERRPAGLSGGEKSRVAIGRALFSAPSLLIMDEPLSALDPARKAEILPHLEYVRDEIGIPILYVSHAMEEVARLANRVVSVAGGRVVAEGEPGAVLGGARPMPDDMEPATFISARISHHLESEGLTVANSRAGRIFLKRSAAEPGDWVRVYISAQDIILGIGEPGNLSALNRLDGRILGLAERGGSVWVTVDCSGEVVLAQVTRHSAARMGLAEGQPVSLLFKSVSIDTQGLFRRQAPDALP